jgi:3-oxoacyl-[acyl-carrier protein] reductase
MTESNKFIKNVVLITGGAQVIGRKTAELFCKEKAQVILWDSNKEALLATISQLGASNIEVDFKLVDTTNSEQVEKEMNLLVKKYGKIDILINNAGLVRGGTFSQITPEQWKLLLDLNLTSTVVCTKFVAPIMKKNGFGRIINTSTVVNSISDFDKPNLAATKSGIAGITKVWSRELGKSGITVNAVAPGFIATEEMPKIAGNNLKSMEERIPAGRLGKAEDVVYAYMFLASQEASYVNGVTLPVDGGYMS